MRRPAGLGFTHQRRLDRSGNLEVLVVRDVEKLHAETIRLDPSHLPDVDAEVLLWQEHVQANVLSWNQAAGRLDGASPQRQIRDLPFRNVPIGLEDRGATQENPEAPESHADRVATAVRHVQYDERLSGVMSVVANCLQSRWPVAKPGVLPVLTDRHMFADTSLRPNGA
jgi:hypothetical protein